MASAGTSSVAVRPGRFDFVSDTEGRRDPGEGVIPNGRVLQLPPDIVAVDIAKPAYRVSR